MADLKLTAAELDRMTEELQERWGVSLLGSRDRIRTFVRHWMQTISDAAFISAQAKLCWLVGNGKPAGLAYRYMDQGVPMWTPDPHKAIRFARREDAEMFAAEDAWRIVPHGFET